MNGKTIDDIIRESDITSVLSAMSADATNVDTRSSMTGPQTFDLPRAALASVARAPEIRQTTARDYTGLSEEDLLGMVMGTMGGGGGARTLKDVVSKMFKKSSKTPFKRTEIPGGEVESGTALWKFLTPEQKKQAAELYTKEFNIETFRQLERAKKGAEQLLTKEVQPVGRLVDYMKLTEGRSSLPLQTLPERVALEISKLMQK